VGRIQDVRSRLTAFLATHAAAGTRTGNRTTALRWAKRMRELGWHVRVGERWGGEPCDVLVGLHARHSAPSIARHAELRPRSPRVVALTGTDLYGDLQADAAARASLDVATRLVVLQPLGARRVPAHMARKVRTIRQSAMPPHEPLHVGPPGAFVACIVGHLREVKDPLLAARAVRLLPDTSRVCALHLGAALDQSWQRRAEAAQRIGAPRWTWLGERPRLEALRILAGANVLLLTSVQEGGANVVTEAIACGIPVLSTRIEGSLGILGEDYHGYFEVGDARGVADLLQRCETERAFLEALKEQCAARRPLTDPAVERESWRALLEELVDG
jgi:putative glycosyltransferase (TIGR04348 family)